VASRRAGAVVSAARDCAYAVIRRVLDQDAYADRALAAEAARMDLDVRDRALAMHLAYGTVQRKRTLDEALLALAGRRADRLERPLAHALRLGAFQVLFAGGVPDAAAVNETVALVRRAVGERAVGLANAVLRRVADGGPDWYTGLPDETPQQAGVRHSLPDAIVRTWWEAYGRERALGLCGAANEPAEFALRPNPLRAAPGEVERELTASGVEYSRDAATGALVVRGPLDLGASRIFRDGLAVAQSRGSILAAARVEASAGQRVLDLCAAPGGKASQLAAAGASVVAVEQHAGRAAELRRTLERLGAHEVQVVEADGRTFGDGRFDAVLVDAPCSGNGILNGRPDARWRRAAADDEALPVLQAQLIESAAASLAPGGRLVYAVCTLAPAENEHAVRAAGYEPRDECRTWPDSDRTTGFYTALVAAP